MEQRRKGRIETHPGRFASVATQEVRDNKRRMPNNRLTHLRLVCAICGQDVTPRIENAMVVAGRFDKHECAPKEESPPLPPRANG